MYGNSVRKELTLGMSSFAFVKQAEKTSFVWRPRGKLSRKHSVSKNRFLLINAPLAKHVWRSYETDLANASEISVWMEIQETQDRHSDGIHAFDTYVVYQLMFIFNAE